MIVTHLYHSGVLVELSHHYLLFDYDQGKLELDNTKPLYVFVSHSHSDHFNKQIFHLQHPHITYILSSDISKTYDAIYVEAQHHYQIDDLHIQTLLSTDLGCAFIVEVEGKSIYHAGDLNWWHWEGEPDEDNEYQKITYQQQINLIKQHIDIAFVVVDQRQENDYLLGLQYYLSHVPTDIIFPIHYFGHYETSQQLFKEKLDNPYQAKIMNIHHAQESFIIDENEKKC